MKQELTKEEKLWNLVKILEKENIELKEKITKLQKSYHDFIDKVNINIFIILQYKYSEKFINKKG